MLKIKMIIILLFGFTLGIYAQTADELIKAGDEFYHKFDHRKALAEYEKAAEIDSNNSVALWKISRAYVDIAEKMPSSTGDQEDAQEAVFIKAVDYAAKAINAAPDSSAPYVRRAIANGKIALFKGVFSVGSVVEAVRDDCLKAIELNNGDALTRSLAHYVLARTHAKLAEKPGFFRWPLGLGWGDIDVALEEYPKAIAIKDDFMMFYVDYAKALISEDEYEDARKMLNKAINCPLTDEDDSKLLEESKNLLKEIEDED